MELELVALTCPVCSGVLQIGPGVSHFACASCGNEYFVQRGGGIIALAASREEFWRARAGYDNSSQKRLLKSLDREIGDLQNRIALIERNRTGYEQEYQQMPKPQEMRNRELFSSLWFIANMILTAAAALAAAVLFERAESLGMNMYGLLPYQVMRHPLMVITSWALLTGCSWLAWYMTRQSLVASRSRGIAALMRQDIAPLEAALAEKRRQVEMIRSN